MREWNDNFDSKRIINGKNIIVGQQDFDNNTIMVKEESGNIIECPMDIDDDCDLYFRYDNMGVYISERLLPFQITKKEYKYFKKNGYEELKPFLVYCEAANNEATPEEVITKISFNYPSKKIHLDEFGDVDNHEFLKQIDNLFTHTNGEVSQFIGPAKDVNDVIIPNTYLVRILGTYKKV